jgi:hypothetical protein
MAQSAGGERRRSAGSQQSGGGRGGRNAAPRPSGGSSNAGGGGAPRGADASRSGRPVRSDKRRAAEQPRSGNPRRGGDGPRAADAGARGAGARRSPADSGSPPARRRSAEPSPPRFPEPPLPDNVDASVLERGVRAELRSLTKLNADVVAAHLVMAGQFLDTDPKRALEHARAARGRASRVGAVREAVGVAAYHAEEWAEALTELRTARRITGDPRTLPLLADCERALGRPNQALRLLNDPDVAKLDAETRAELLIVIAGARRDLGQVEAALAVLARGGLDPARPRPGSARLWYAYADALQEAGRAAEAAKWFAASAALDVDGETDAAQRAAALL